MENKNQTAPDDASFRSSGAVLHSCESGLTSSEKGNIMVCKGNMHRKKLKEI